MREPRVWRRGGDPWPARLLSPVGALYGAATILRRWSHQPYRAPLVPGLDEIISLRLKGLLGCALSGAGPSILVFYQRGYEHVCQSVQHVFTAHGKDSEVMLTELANKGYELS